MFKPGLHKVQCDRCGKIYRSHQVVMDGYNEGLVVCRGPGTRDCYDPKHPQDQVRTRHDDVSVANARPFNWQSRGAVCSGSGRSGIVGYAVAGCSIVSLEPSF